MIDVANYLKRFHIVDALSTSVDSEPAPKDIETQVLCQLSSILGCPNFRHDLYIPYQQDIAKSVKILNKYVCELKDRVELFVKELSVML